MGEIRAIHQHRSAATVLLFALCSSLLFGAAPVKKRQQKSNKEQKRVYLVHADQLKYDRFRNNDAQVLTGKVEFLHDGARLFCDSANFFEQTNSFEAFGHVRMFQGDTLSLHSDYGYYDGNDQLMEALHNVVLRHRGSTLYTDSLYYDRSANVGYFQEGGQLVDNTTTLVSDWGEYHTDRKLAIFYYDVKMTDNDYTLYTDSLYYDTHNSMAEIVGPSRILSGTSTIFSDKGFYNTKTDESLLLNRSVLLDGGKKLIGDSVFYDSNSGQSRAIGNIVYTDSLNQNMMTGNYGEYNEQTGYALCTDSALAIDYSQGDSLFLHADTFKVYTYNINTDSVFRMVHGYNHVRAYRSDVQAVCDSLVYNQRDSLVTLYYDPVMWNLGDQLLGERIDIFMRDTTIDRAHVIDQALSVEQLPEGDNYNQVASKEMFAFFTGGEISMAQAKDNVLIVYYPKDEADSTYTGMVSAETAEMRIFIAEGQMTKVWMPKAEGVMYPMSQIPPDKKRLPSFVWLDEMRPKSRSDVFIWVDKPEGTSLRKQSR